MAFILMAGLKFRFIARTIKEVPTIYSVWGYVFEDFIVWALISGIIYWKLRKLWLILIPLFFVSVVNIIFISKTGYPMSSSLFSQMGDLMMLQTSIDSPSIYRNFYILFAVLGTFIISLISVHKLQFKNKTIFIIAASLMFFLLALSSISRFNPKHNFINRFSSNIFISLFSPPTAVGNILKKEYFKGMEYKRWVQYSGNKNSTSKKNILLIIIETLKADLPDDVIPNINKLKKNSVEYLEHYASWPFSSKSLYSIMCAQPPHPSNLIELKVGEGVACQDWAKDLFDNHGYQGFVGYTGDLGYDNMRNFFKRSGFSTVLDRKILNEDKKYKSTRLSIDDHSMVEKFESWRKESKKPFLGVFITMNSHHPFWTPDEKFKKFNDNYLDAIHYQDHIVKLAFESLRKTSQLKDTIVIITGDHGRREAGEATSVIPKSMFHIPLIIYDENEKGRKVKYPTAHYDIGASLIKKAVGKKYGFNNFNLDSKKERLVMFETNEMTFSLLSEDKKTVLDKAGRILIDSKKWPSSDSESCNINTCIDEFEKYYDFIKNLEVYYGI